MNTEAAQQIAHKLRQARRVLLIPGTNPDGDSLGSVCAVFGYLKRQDIPVEIFCPAPVPSNLQFLPYADRITNDERAFENADVVMVFDAGDLRYAGIAERLPKMSARPFIINIDHHASNEYYGDINLVVKDAAATTEVLYAFFTALGVSPDPDMATCLLTGIITDTDYFSNAATTGSSMATASELIARGARLHAIREHTLNNKPVALLKLWGITLARLYYQPTHRSAITYVFQKDYEHFGLDEADVYGIANFLNRLGEGNYSLFLKETTDGHVKGSLRTTRDDVDVSAIAKRFGGGGHQKAAGFKVPGRLTETERGVKIVQN